MPRFRYWIATIPFQDWHPEEIDHLPWPIKWAKGQAEIGDTTLFFHWQATFHTDFCTRRQLKNVLCESAHLEPSRSKAVDSYCWKEDTHDPTVDRWEIGTKTIHRHDKKDWEKIWDSAIRGDLLAIPADIRVRNYRTLKDIQRNYLQPVGQQRQVCLYIGPSGTGKTSMALALGGRKQGICYTKDPNTKYWDGYLGHSSVVIDEYRGAISISHLLRWLDPHPLILECKFGAMAANYEKVAITTNLDPRNWYPALDGYTLHALLRRMLVYEISWTETNFIETERICTCEGCTERRRDTGNKLYTFKQH